MVAPLQRGANNQARACPGGEPCGSDYNITGNPRQATPVTGKAFAKSQLVTLSGSAGAPVGRVVRGEASFLRRKVPSRTRLRHVGRIAEAAQGDIKPTWEKPRVTGEPGAPDKGTVA